MVPHRFPLMFACAAALWAAVGAGAPVAAQPPLEPLPPPTMPEAAPRSGPLLPEDRPISSIGAQIHLKPENLPQDHAGLRFQERGDAFCPRMWDETVYFWDAPAFCYQPLRYEETNLERQGFTHYPVIQPAISGAHFFVSTLALPYSMTANPPTECIYPLGHYRPGSPVPYRWHRPELDVKAGGVEAGVITGLIFLIP